MEVGWGGYQYLLSSQVPDIFARITLLTNKRIFPPFCRSQNWDLREVIILVKVRPNTDEQMK